MRVLHELNKDYSYIMCTVQLFRGYTIPSIDLVCLPYVVRNLLVSFLLFTSSKDDSTVCPITVSCRISELSYLFRVASRDKRQVICTVGATSREDTRGVSKINSYRVLDTGAVNFRWFSLRLNFTYSI